MLSMLSGAMTSPLKPFTPATLKRIRNILDQSSPLDVQSSTTKARNAAVLIPFCNVGDKPGILLQLRAMTLRNHSGEIRHVNPGLSIT
jgi:hypothetical protein